MVKMIVLQHKETGEYMSFTLAERPITMIPVPDTLPKLQSEFWCPVTQFLRPDGRQEQMYAPLPLEVEAIAEAVLAAGLTFQCEVLRTGAVSVTISSTDEDLFGFLSNNGPEITGHFVNMLKRWQARQERLNARGNDK